MLQVKELEQVEQMELETLAEALPTSKALREKKLKMKETIDRVIKCYEKESDKDMVCSNFTYSSLLYPSFAFIIAYFSVLELANLGRKSQITKVIIHYHSTTNGCNLSYHGGK